MAITSSINLDKVSGGVNSLNTGLGQLKKSADTIKTVSLNKIKIKRESISRNKLIGNMRDEAVKRRDQESIVEASGIGGAFKRTGSVIGNSTKGFLDRLLDFTSTLLTGWLLYNLPTILTGIENLITRIKSLYGILTGFISNITNTFQNFGTLLSAVYQNIIQFDFMDHSKRVQNAMDDLNVNIDLMNDQFMEGFDLLTTPLGEGPEEKPIPPLNTDYTQPAPTTGTPTPSAGGGGGGSPDFWTLAAVSALEDGDPQGRADVAQSIYNRASSGVFGTSSIRSIILSGNGKQYEPVGRAVKEFNAIRDRAGAIRAIMKADKLSKSEAEKIIDDTVSAINNTTLRKNAAEFVENRTDFLGAGLTPERPSSTRLRRRNPNDNVFGNYVGPGSYEYGKKSKGQASSTNLQFPNTSSSAQTSTKIVQVPPGKINPIVGDRLGAGRNHGGTDLAVNNGTPLRAVSDGVIVDSDFEKGWGNFLVMKDNLGIYHLYGHMQSGYKRSGSVKRGEIIGKVGMTGRTTGPHLHWEAGTGWNGGVITGRFDPLNKYSKFAPFNTPYSGKSTPAQVSPSLSPTPSAQVFSRLPQAQVSSTTAPGQNTPPITQNRRGPQIMFVNPAQPSEPQQVSSGGGGGTTIQSMPTEYPLNSMIKNQILLELAYT